MKRFAVAAVAVVLVAGIICGWMLQRHRHNLVATSARPAAAASPRTIAASAGDSQRLFSKVAQLPLSFEENRGQFDPDVKFATRGADYGLFLSGAQATIVHHGKVHLGDSDVSSMVAALGNAEVRTLSTNQLTWLGANPKAEPRGVDRDRSESNYFIGNDPKKWHRHVRHYDRVQLTGLYPGIDLVYHGAQKQVEFDYVVAPHVDPSAIRVGISGPSIVGLDASGQLSISSSGDKMLLLPPVAYQEKNGKREMVEAHYALADSHQFGFRLGQYDTSRPLIIDPVLQFAVSFGPNVNDTIVTDVALDASGDIYITGTTCETNYPTTAGVFQPGGGSIANFCNDAIVTKLDSSASSLIYSTYIGGQTGVDFAVRMLIDSAGEATIVGTTGSTDFPTTAGVYQSSAKGGSCDYGPNVSPNIPCTDAFLLKLSADGSSLDYSTYFGGERAEFGIALAQDSAGNSYVGGATDSTALPLAGSPFQGTYGGGGNCQGNKAPCFDGFIAKFNPTGTQLLASTYLGGTKDDLVAAVALDAAGDVYVTGVADSTNFPTTTGAIQTAHAGTSQGDAYLSKLDGNLHTLQYSTFLGGASDDIAFAVRVDASGAAYITGSTLSSDFPTTAGAFQTKYKGPDPSTAFCISGLDTGILSQPTCGDVFVSKIDPSKPSGSQLIFSTFLGGSGNDFAYNLQLDSQNNVWVVGDTNSADFPYTSDAYFATQQGPMFLSELKNDGSQLIFSTGLAASGSGLALGIDIDSANNVYVTGQGTVSATPGTYSFGTPGQIFVEKYSTGTAQPGVQLSATTLNFTGVTNAVSAPQSVFLTNSGTGPLHLSISLINGTTGNPLAFSESDTCPATLAPQANCAISVTYLPTNPNGDGGTVQILDDAPGAPHNIQLSGSNALTTSTSFVPATLSFPGQQPGVASPAQTSGLTSDSAGANNIFATVTAAPVLSGPNASEFAVDTSQCLAKANGCSVSVTFTPAASATGTRTATLTVPSTAPNSPHTLALTGTVATGPFAVLSTGGLQATTVGQTLSSELFVKNTGGGTLNVTAINVTGANAGDFVINGGSCGTAFTLAPQANCFANLAFTPSAPGNRTATVTLADNETTPASLALNAIGAASGGPQINSNIFGNPVFTDTTVGQNTSFFAVPVTLTNSGTGASAVAHVTSVTLSDGNFMTGSSTLGPTCAAGVVLAASQGNCALAVFFQPTTAGPHSGTLTIGTDAPGTPSFSFKFSGTGIQTAGVSLTPTTLNFAKEVVGGTSAPQTVTLKNTGNGVLNISGVGVPAPFTETTTCGATLAAGASCTFSVGFKPTVAGPASALLTFTGNAAGGGQFAVGVSGIGATGPAPQAVPPSLTFGNQAINSTSPPKTVVFSNAGDTAFSFVGLHASENYSATSNCPASIAPGASCNINISFSPTNDIFTGFQTSGSVFITTNAPNSPFAITVSGTATQSTGAATTATISSSLNPSTVGQAVTFTATITSTTAGTPTGTVTFLDGGNALGAPVTLPASGKATFTTSSLTAGNHSIFCMYSGDATFAPATSSGIGQMVETATSTVVTSSLNPSTVGASVTFTAAVTSTAGPVTGSVEFFDGATSISNPTSLVAGSATLAITTLTQGTHSITAQYFGGGPFASSTSPALSQVVNAAGGTAATTTTLASSLNPSTAGQTVTFTATATSATAGTLTGTISFFDGATQLGGPVTIAAGAATFSTSTLAVATHSITAKYSGDAKFATSTSAALSQVVNKTATTTVVVSSLNPSTTGQAVTFTATATPAIVGIALTGTISFFDGATQIGAPVTIAAGMATLSSSTLAQGTHSITAKYSGDANFTTSTSTALSQVVNAGALISTTTTLTGPATATSGANVTFMASVTPVSGTKVPTGTVMFLDGATNLGSGTLNGSGSTTFSSSTLSVGTHSVSAQYGGDANFATSTSTALSINITAAAGSFTLSASPGSVNVTASQAGMAVITVTPTNGFNQAVQFSCSNLPEGIDCEFQPGSVTLNGGPITTMLAISEGVAGNSRGRKSAAGIGKWTAGGGANSAALAMKTLFAPVFGCELLLLAGLWRRKQAANHRGAWQAAFAMLLLVTIATFAGGCSDMPHTRTTGAVITVTGTGPNNQTATVPLTINIQK